MSVVADGSLGLATNDCFGVLHRLLFPYSSSRSSKTFKPKKNIPEGTHQYDLMKHAAATLGSGNLRNAVALPDGEDPNEWVAVNSEFPLINASVCIFAEITVAFDS